MPLLDDVNDLSAEIALDNGQALSVTLAQSASEDWTVALERREGSASWVTEKTWSADVTAERFENHSGKRQVYRLNAKHLAGADPENPDVEITYTFAEVTGEIMYEILNPVTGLPEIQFTDQGVVIVNGLVVAGGTSSGSGFTFPLATAPSQTDEGSAVWDSDNDELTIGDGSARKTLLNSIMTKGDAAGVSQFNIGADATEGLHVKTIREIVDLDSLGALFADLTTPIPAGAVILSAQLNIDTAVVAGGTTVKIALGISGGDVDKYGITAGLSKDEKINTIPDWAVLSSEEQISVCGVVTNGSALGDTNISAGAVEVLINYLQLLDLGDYPEE